jgi:hypothetical protein
MLAGLVLAAVIALALTRPATAPVPKPPPLPTGMFVFDQLAVYDTADPFHAEFATVNLHEPDRSGGPAVIGTRLPAPWEHWQIVEIAPSTPPGAGYVVLKHDQTGQRFIAWEDPARPGRTGPPKPLPVPLWPGIGCIGVMPDIQNTSVWHADLTGGAYTVDATLGTFHVGDLLPGAWSRWRVKELIHRPIPIERRRPIRYGDPAFEYACVIVNDDTGQTARLPFKQLIDLPRDSPLVTPTTAQPATQPAATSLPSQPLLVCDRVLAGKAHISVIGGKALGWFRMNDLLPKPYDQWRVHQFHPAYVDKETGVIVEAGVTVWNDKTARTVRLPTARSTPTTQATARP